MNKKHLSFLTVAGSALVLGGCLNVNNQATEPQDATTPLPTTEPTLEQQTMSPTPSEMIGKEVQKDTTYQSPAGTENITFKLVVDSSGQIASAEAMVKATNPISKMRQESFAKDFPAVIVGQNLAQLKDIDRVGGSSLTTKAFNSALTDLQAQSSM